MSAAFDIFHGTVYVGKYALGGLGGGFTAAYGGKLADKKFSAA